MAMTAAATPAYQTWTPSHLNLDAFVAQPGGFEATVNARYDLRPEGQAVDVTTQTSKLVMNGQVVGGSTKTAPFSPAERTAMAAVRDALAGSNYLKDAKPYVEGPQPANTIRFSWADHDGAKQMVELDPTKSIAGYEALGNAIQAYTNLTGLKDM